MIEQIGILARGNKVFEVLDFTSTAHLDKSFFNLSATPVALETGSILTFRDVVEKIIAVNDPYRSCESLRTLVN